MKNCKIFKKKEIEEVKKEVDIDKYKFLYEYEKNLFEEEVLRYRRLEDKAMKYLTSITFIMGSYLFLIRAVIEKFIPPTDCIECAILITTAITCGLYIFSLNYILKTIKPRRTVKMDSGEETINYFKNNTIAPIYLGLSKKYSKGIESIEKSYEKKLNYINQAHSSIIWASISLIISVIFILIQKWNV